MDLIEIVSLTSATPSVTPSASIIMLTLIPFIVVGCVVVTVFFMRRRQKRRMRDV
jgi:preprotein translocase subunit YajC